MGMHVFKKYSDEDKMISDEFYSSDEFVSEHISLTLKYLDLGDNFKFATAFGVKNPYTNIIKKLGYDVKEYETFEKLLKDRQTDRVVIDNPPFSTASKDRLKLEKLGFKYSLIASGTWFPKCHKFGAILFKQPRKYFTNRNEQVLCAIFHNFNDNIYSEYKKVKPNKYKKEFIAVNLNEGIYKRSEIK